MKEAALKEAASFFFLEKSNFSELFMKRRVL